MATAIKKECARKRRNAYRDLVIEYYARNSSSVLAITHCHWPDRAWTSQPELARILSELTGWDWDYRSLSRQLRRFIGSTMPYGIVSSNCSEIRLFMPRTFAGKHFVADVI